MSLVVAPCDTKAARHAVTHWHYSETMPSGRLIMLGVWEDGAYIGCVLFGRGANDRLLRPYGLRQSEGCELVRVALTTHRAPVSQIVAEALRQLRRRNPGLRLVVSFADPAQGHHGGIYQAGGWLYLGRGAEQTEWIVNGRQVHARSVSAMREAAQPYPARRIRDGEARVDWLRRVHDPSARPITVPGKHRYVMPLDRAMRRLVSKRAKPYPARAVEASTGRG